MSVKELLELYGIAAEHERTLNGKPRIITQRATRYKLLKIIRESGQDTEHLHCGALPEVTKCWAKRQLGLGVSRNSVATTVRIAQGVRAQWVLRYMRDHSVDVPKGLTDHWASVRRDPVEYEPPDKRLVEKTITAATAEIDGRTNLGLALILTLYCGMGMGDAMQAKWDWFNGTAVRYKRQKTGKVARPVLPQKIADAVASWPGRDSREYVLHGKAWRKYTAFRAISKWMLNLGWDTQKKSHELRKLAGSIWITQTGNLAAAAAMLGDRNSTAEQYYAKILDSGMPAIKDFL